MSAYVSANNNGIPIRYATPRTNFYSFGSWRQGLSTDTPPQNVIGVETGEAFPANGTAGLQTAINLSTQGISQKDASIALITEFFGGTPSTVSISLQIADIDQASSYKTFATTTNTGGDEIVVTGIQGNFARAIVNSSTGTTGITFAAKLIVK